MKYGLNCEMYSPTKGIPERCDTIFVYTTHTESAVRIERA